MENDSVHVCGGQTLLCIRYLHGGDLSPSVAVNQKLRHHTNRKEEKRPEDRLNSPPSSQLHPCGDLCLLL